MHNDITQHSYDRVLVYCSGVKFFSSSSGNNGRNAMHIKMAWLANDECHSARQSSSLQALVMTKSMIPCSYDMR